MGANDNESNDRFGVMSCVEGNYEALKAVIRALRTEGVETICSIGGLVGLGNQYRECLDAAADFPVSLQGIHDAAVADVDQALTFGSPGRELLFAWTRRSISTSDREQLRSMPSAMKYLDVFFSSNMYDRTPGVSVSRWIGHPSNYSHEPFLFRAGNVSEKLNVGSFMTWEETKGMGIFPGMVHCNSGLGRAYFLVCDPAGLIARSTEYDPNPFLSFVASVPGIDERYIAALRRTRIA